MGHPTIQETLHVVQIRSCRVAAVLRSSIVPIYSNIGIIFGTVPLQNANIWVYIRLGVPQTLLSHNRVEILHTFSQNVPHIVSTKRREIRPKYLTLNSKLKLTRRLR